MACSEIASAGMENRICHVCLDDSLAITFEPFGWTLDHHSLTKTKTAARFKLLQGTLFGTL